MSKKLMISCIGILLMTGAVHAAGSKTFVTYRSLTLETALKLAQATLAACRKADSQVSVAVLDRGGKVQVIMSDRFAGPHTPDTARRKAFTAISFRTNTRELRDISKAGGLADGVRYLPGVTVAAGGLMILAAGELVGGIGVSGASQATDEECAKKGLEAIEEELNF